MIALIHSHHNLYLPVLISSVTVVKTVKTFATTVNVLCVTLLFSMVKTVKMFTWCFILLQGAQ